jgi:hypothetical protein
MRALITMTHGVTVIQPRQDTSNPDGAFARTSKSTNMLTNRQAHCGPS